MSLKHPRHPNQPEHSTPTHKPEHKGGHLKTVDAQTGRMHIYKLSDSRRLPDHAPLRSLRDSSQEECTEITSEEVDDFVLDDITVPIVPIEIDRHPAVHALGLSKWSSNTHPKTSKKPAHPAKEMPAVKNQSVNNMIGVLHASNLPHVEIAFAPFWNPTEPFENIIMVIEALKARMQLTITIYFSIHAPNNTDPLYQHAPSIGHSIVKEAKIFDSQLLATYGSDTRISFVLCPSIEDKWGASSAGFIDLATQIAAQLTWANADRVTFRRNGDTAHTPDPLKAGLLMTKRKPDQTLCDTKPFPLQSEWHSTLHQAEANGFQVCSNDGYLLYVEHKETAKSSNLTTTAAPISSIKSATLASLPKGHTRTKSVQVYSFWRPMYNLWHRHKMDPLYTEKQGERTWQDVLQDNEDHPKFDNPAFDHREKEALHEFLSFYKIHATR